MAVVLWMQISQDYKPMEGQLSLGGAGLDGQKMSMVWMTPFN